MGALTCTRPLNPNSSRHLHRLHKRVNDRSRAIVRRRCVNVKAFRNDIDGVMLPMDAYRVRILTSIRERCSYNETSVWYLRLIVHPYDILK